ncbi:hypothetical protein GCM10009552_16260 [Rothia nasimurium]|uniref:Uncharacterized protein n=1 Tax=Luteibacter anthropi TaxID=564369 RepID=A0A7X5UBN1_9GAMM|nr:hypothetical protein [Luteibacter anthropi]NII07283.1 hypothetical protein [Luteibacter anthropi]
MAFQFHPTLGAVDETRQIIVTSSARFYDDLINRLHYTYIHDDMTLEFVAVTDTTHIPGAKALPGSGYIQSWTTASHVDEILLRAAFAEAIYPKPPDETRYVSIRNSLREGLFVLVTRGGTYSGVSPDFVVDFNCSID